MIEIICPTPKQYFYKTIQWNPVRHFKIESKHKSNFEDERKDIETICKTIDILRLQNKE